MAKIKVMFLFLTVLTGSMWFISIYNRPANSNAEETSMGKYRDLIEGIPISQTGFRAYGGRSPIEEYGITVKEYPDKIVLRSFQIWRRGDDGFDKETIISKQEYENLWNEIEKFDIWKQKSSLAPYFDGFVYDFTFLRNGKAHNVEAGEVGLLDNVARLLDRLAYNKLGVRLYDDAKSRDGSKTK